ncbi:hypothetical protein [Desulfovibrio inopinatus]|uniref:hypothetical protein n=1 Tax=Desulfovibrio inopinatus TaxID=102109 RepID=UPI0003F6AA2D|nr:hypothetical protein [Desulfovibrio inopinatus]
MDANKIYDTIIIGGGPAGLAVGSELSADHDIIVIDKEYAGKTTKSWFVPLDVVNEDVMPYTYNGVTTFMTQTYGGANLNWRAELFDRYPYVDEHALLAHWIEVIKSNGGDIINTCSYSDHNVTDGIVSVETTAGILKTRLLIDASGQNSPILQKYHIDRSNDYWWSVYGSVGKHPNGLNGMKVGDYMLWQTFEDSTIDPDASMANGRPVFEYEILDESTSFSFVFYLRKERMPLEFMEKEYMKVIREEPTTPNFHDLEIQELKHGWYPSGTVSSQQIAEDHVVFIGDAGCWTTPCGWGMTFILRNYRHFSQQMHTLLTNNTLDKSSLLSVPHYETHENFEVLLDAIVTHFLSNATASQLNRFINLFEDIPKILCEKVFTLCITREEVHVMAKAMFKEFDLTELVHILTKEDYCLLLEEARFFAEDTFLEEMQKVFHRHHGSSTDIPLSNGYDFQ